MSNYYEVFQQRCYNRGLNFKDVVQKQAELSFQRFLKSSPNTVEVKVNNEGNPIRVATILDKENDTLYKRYFLCDKNDNIKIGDFLYWEDSIWLVFKKVIDTIHAYDKFDCIECRHHIKWIDNVGVLRETPCYLVAQTDEKIKANFRTWNNMITPQPNKFMEIITSRTNIQLGQKFLVDETAWFVVESDYISVKDILYLSLTEDKKDLYTDDIENNIANIIDLNKFILKIQTNNVKLGVGESYQLDGRIYLNGLYYSDDIVLEIIEGKEYVEIDKDMNIKAIAPGVVSARVSMEDHPEISEPFTILIEETAQEPLITYELRGDESIKWGRTKIYQCIKNTNGIEELIPCEFTIEDENKLLKEFEINNSTITITANEDNKIGTVKLVAKIDLNTKQEEPTEPDTQSEEETEEVEENVVILEREIKVTSLWM